MKFLTVWIFYLLFQLVKTERAGITHCSTESYGNSGTGGTPGTSSAYLMQDPAYQFACCGVVDNIAYTGSGPITLQIWRQNDDTNFELISKQAYTLSGPPFTPDDDKRVSFREGDLFGWSGGSIQRASSATTFLSWVSSPDLSASSVGATHNWYSESIDSGSEYQIQVVTQASTEPYFRNLPVTLSYADTDLLVGGVTLMTLSYNDLDPDDASDLTVSMSPAWNDLFELSTDTPPLIKTKESLGPGTYMPEFRVEEAHCGKTATATLTVSVTDSMPSITNLPGFATVHEDDLDETLLYTVTMSDPTNQAMWCKGDWTIGKETDGNIPFIVKMISTTGGSSEAGIYLIEDPGLDYGSQANYDLTIECKDTFGNTVTGSFFVNVIENQPPIFTNLPNMVQVDALTDVTGTTVLTISTTDYDSDQITFNFSCSPSGCPFDVFHSGEVKVTENLLNHTDASMYTLTVTANDLRGSSTARDLIIYIINVNTKPTFSNVNSRSVTVYENTALGTSIYQMTATDVDSTDTLTYYMTINDTVGYGLFELSTSGELSTHSKYAINYELLDTDTFFLRIVVYDGKERTRQGAAFVFQATVNNTNEAPYFLANEYLVTQAEGNAVAFTNNPIIGQTEDPDSGDTLTYSRDCGTTSDTYINIDPATGELCFVQPYDLDSTALALTTFIQCTVYVTDAGGLNDSASMYINVEYANDKSPVFSPKAYTVDVSSATPLGYAVIRVTATDADLGDVGSTLTYSLDQSHIGSGDHFIIEDGVIYATELLTSLASEGTKTANVTVSDGTNTNDTATVTMTFIDSVVPISPTTDRNWEFIEDQRNITWLTMSVVTIVTCLLLILCALVRAYRKRDTPLVDFRKLWPKSKPKRQLDKKRRPMPFGRQAEPRYQHVHADQVLRLASPAPVDADSMRPDSATTGRVTVTEVRVNETRWIDEYNTPALSVAPVKSITRPRTEEMEYIHPKRRSSITLSPDQMYGTEMSSLSHGSALSKQRRTTAQRLTPALHIPVSPSPMQFDHVGNDDDDFKSERLSVATPGSQFDPDDPIY